MDFYSIMTRCYSSAVDMPESAVGTVSTPTKPMLPFSKSLPIDSSNILLEVRSRDCFFRGPGPDNAGPPRRA